MLICSAISFTQNEKENYVRFFDSADVYVTSNPKLANKFMDSIPRPSDKYIKGQVDRYYAIKARVQYEFHEFTEAYRLWLLSLKYAEDTNDIGFAAYASTRTFLLLAELGDDVEADKYFKKAKTYYIQQDDLYGLMDTKQIPAFLKFDDKKWQECITMLERDLIEYKKLEKQYLYSYALHMMACSHLNLGNYNDGLKYSKLYNELDDINRVTKESYYEAYQKYYLANYFFNNQSLDSTLYYLKEVYKIKPYMDHVFKSDLYNLAIKTYSTLGQDELKFAYSDSLSSLESEIKEAGIRSGIKMSEILIRNKQELEKASKKKRINFFIALAFLSLAIILFVLFYKNRIKIKSKVAGLKDKLAEIAYLQSNQQKMVTKLEVLEDYIQELKRDIKKIAKINNIEAQRNQIMALYRNIHSKSVDVLSIGESHMKLINEFNTDFFIQINKIRPLHNQVKSELFFYNCSF